MPARVLANLALQPYRKGQPADHDALGGRLHPQRFLPLRCAFMTPQPHCSDHVVDGPHPRATATARAGQPQAVMLKPMLLLLLACDTTPSIPAADLAAGAPPISHWADEGLATDGYDVVAYFTDGAAVLGSAEHTLDWGGAEWRFSSAENLTRFAEEPLLYTPQYGAYCSWAMADDRLATTDATAWDIVDGKLYLNYDADVRELWLEDIAGFIAAADTNWAAKLAAAQ